MRVGGLIILLVTPAYFKEFSIRKVDVFRPEVSRDVCAPEDDPGMPAVTYQVDRLGNRIVTGWKQILDWGSARAAGDHHEEVHQVTYYAHRDRPINAAGALPVVFPENLYHTLSSRYPFKMVM
jgi:hypothetical protein